MVNAELVLQRMKDEEPDVFFEFLSQCKERKIDPLKYLCKEYILEIVDYIIYKGRTDKMLRAYEIAEENPSLRAAFFDEGFGEIIVYNIFNV